MHFLMLHILAGIPISARCDSPGFLPGDGCCDDAKSEAGTVSGENKLASVQAFLQK